MGCAQFQIRMRFNAQPQAVKKRIGQFTARALVVELRKIRLNCAGPSQEKSTAAAPAPDWII